MDLKDEKELVDHSYKKEIRKIWWNRGLASITIVILGIVSFYVAPEFASQLRKDEITHQYDLELKKERQQLYYDKRFSGYVAIDKHYNRLTEDYRLLVWKFDVRKDTFNFNESFSTIENSIGVLFKEIESYRLFLDTFYLENLYAHLGLYAALRHIEPSEWKKLKPFFADLHYSLNKLAYYDLLITDQDSLFKTDIDVYYISNYSPPSGSLSVVRRYEANYLDSTFSSWKQSKK